MDLSAAIPALDALVERLRDAGWKDRESVRGELLALASQVEDFSAVRGYLEQAKKGLKLEVRWEVDAVIDALEPPPEPEPELGEEEEADDPSRPLGPSDLNLVYHDPRGLMLYKTKRLPERWFATQTDPRTGQPQTFELHASEVTQLRTQLAGSPYWVLGAGGAAD